MSIPCMFRLFSIEHETEQNERPLGSSTAERQRIGCQNAWPFNSTQTPYLWSPIQNLSSLVFQCTALIEVLDLSCKKCGFESWWGIFIQNGLLHAYHWLGPLLPWQCWQKFRAAIFQNQYRIQLLRLVMMLLALNAKAFRLDHKCNLKVGMFTFACSANAQ